MKLEIFWGGGLSVYKGGFPGGSEVKASACSVGKEDPLEKEIAIHSSILAWGIPWWATVHGVAESDTTERLHFIHFQCIWWKHLCSVVELLSYRDVCIYFVLNQFYWSIIYIQWNALILRVQFHDFWQLWGTDIFDRKMKCISVLLCSLDCCSLEIGIHRKIWTTWEKMRPAWNKEE